MADGDILHYLFEMKFESVRTIAGLQRAWNSRNRRMAKLYRQPYILQPALAPYREAYERLETIEDASERYQAFRRAPSLEHKLERINAGLSRQHRFSLAQQDRAMHPRVRLTKDGQTAETIIFELLHRLEDPWRQKAKEYWRPMIDRLRQLGLNPTVLPSPARPSNERLEYDCGERRQSLTLGRFQNIVSRVRRSLPRRLKLTASG
jgi:hypothetical protein